MTTEKVLALGVGGIEEKEISMPSSASMSKASFTLAAGQTDVLITGGYPLGGIIVFLNGVYLTPTEYDATSETEVILDTPAELDDILDIIILSANSGLGDIAAALDLINGEVI